MEAFFENKINEMEKVFENFLPKKKILVWGAGRHTEKLLEYSSILQFDNIIIADKYNYGRNFFGKSVVDIDDVDLNAIDIVVISSLKYQDEIEELLMKDKFRGEIIKLYEKEEKSEFFKLQSRDIGGGVFEEEFRTWEDAVNNSLGYGQQNILEKVRKSTLEVIKGNAAYERDSVLFKDKMFSFHIISYIAKLSIGKEKIVIVDYGGALGSTYLQNKEFFQDFPVNIEYNIVEQQDFVNEGNIIFGENESVNFKYALKEIQEKIDLIIFSGVLQYIDNYEEVLLEALGRHAQYIIVDRTLVSDRERIYIQKAPEFIYESSAIPVRIFQREKLLELFAAEYDLEYEFHSFVDEDIYFPDGKVAYKGFILRRKC